MHFLGVFFRPILYRETSGNLLQICNRIRSADHLTQPGDHFIGLDELFTVLVIYMANFEFAVCIFEFAVCSLQFAICTLHLSKSKFANLNLQFFICSFSFANKKRGRTQPTSFLLIHHFIYHLIWKQSHGQLSHQSILIIADCDL